MREMKCKAWDKINKRWMKLFKLILAIDGSPLAVVELGALDATNEMYCMQRIELVWWTGLHDKNGKEIYEGDLLDVDNHKRVCQVVWFEPQACFDTIPIKVIDKHEAFSRLENNEWRYRTEVIGNIYEEAESDPRIR